MASTPTPLTSLLSLDETKRRHVIANSLELVQMTKGKVPLSQPHMYTVAVVCCVGLLSAEGVHTSPMNVSTRMRDVVHILWPRHSHSCLHSHQLMCLCVPSPPQLTVLSSGTSRPLELRGPYDVANLYPPTGE